MSGRNSHHLGCYPARTTRGDHAECLAYRPAQRIVGWFVTNEQVPLRKSDSGQQSTTASYTF